jgi:hypothetical protein
MLEDLGNETHSNSQFRTRIKGKSQLNKKCSSTGMGTLTSGHKDLSKLISNRFEVYFRNFDNFESFLKKTQKFKRSKILFKKSEYESTLADHKETIDKYFSYGCDQELK